MDWFAKENLWPHSKSVGGVILTLIATFEVLCLIAMIPWTFWIGFTALVLIYMAIRGAVILMFGRRKTPPPQSVNCVSELIKERPLP